MYLALIRQTPDHPVCQILAPSRMIINKAVRNLNPDFWRIRDNSGWTESSEPNAYAALYGPISETRVYWHLAEIPS